MDRLFVQGPAKLSGNVEISCAKNAYLPIMAALPLTKKPIYLKKLPKLRDINTMKLLLGNLGIELEEKEDGIVFDASKMNSYEATYELVKTMRASIFILGPLLGRFGKAKVSLPGGCAIGTRPIDIHLDNLAKMNVSIKLEGGYVFASTDELKGAHMVLSFPSVGATENLMMAGVYAKGETIIENAAKEPEIEDLANFLNSLGAKIEGAGTSIIKVTGVSELNEGTYQAIGDRIEAATYIMAGLITKSEIIVKGFNPSHISSVIEILKKAGAKLEIGDDFVKTFPCTLKGVIIDTAPYPGYPTDAQAQIISLMTQSLGATTVSENIFENRFMHVPELVRMGAKIIIKGNIAIIEGEKELTAAPVMCTDLRASAALVLAALVAKGETEIRRVYHIDRGYEDIDNKLINLGVKVKRINDGT